MYHPTKQANPRDFSKNILCKVNFFRDNFKVNTFSRCENKTGQHLDEDYVQAVKNLPADAPWHQVLFVKYRRFVAILIPWTTVMVVLFLTKLLIYFIMVILK